MLRCSICVLDERFSKIELIDGRYICRECLVFMKYPPDYDKMLREVEEVLFREGNNYDCILGLSGGKDSCVALKILVDRFKVRPLAVTVDTGFIDETAMDNCREVTDRLGVEWKIVKENFIDIYREAFERFKSPCRKCSRRILSILRLEAVKRGLNVIVSGHELPFGHSAIRLMKGNVKLVRILAPFKMRESEKEKILRELGWIKPELPGYTTNCLVIGPAIVNFYNMHGYNFEIERIAALVRHGLLERKKALKLIEKPKIDEKLIKELEKRGLKLKKFINDLRDSLLCDDDQDN